MRFNPNKESIKQHVVPEWFYDDKFGIFIHWGLFSVPAFAVRGLNLIESEKRGLEEHFKNNPYAEWYLNSLRIDGSPTQEYHYDTYGKDFSYDNFVPIFNGGIKKWDPEKWAELFKKAGAKYVVLVTKHHDGFLLWPSKYPNPKKEKYCASRNVVHELTEAVRKRGMKMGLYYSGTLDWSFNSEPIVDAQSFLQNGVRTPEYIEYANNHWKELIDLYHPKILWNDIGYPPTDLYSLFSYYYNEVSDGLVNDRWDQIKTKQDNFPKMRHSDFLTPEYTTFEKTQKKKWEANRGIGNSYGYNRMETEEDYLDAEELIKMLVDIVSKNGNLLLNVGPMEDGTIPEIQESRLLSLGQWLEVNGEAIYGTRPWKKAEDKTAEGINIRYAQKQDQIYFFLLEPPQTPNITIESPRLENCSAIELLGYGSELDWNLNNQKLRIIFPKNVSYSPVHVLKLIYRST